MIRPEEAYKIGRIGRAHGVKGEVSFQFSDDVFDRTDADYLILEIDGILVPFFIEEYRFRNDSIALVKFCDIDTQQRASELTGCDVYFPRRLSDGTDGELTYAALVGFQMVDAATGQTVGTVASVDDTTANILFELTDGKLIPASEELVRGIDVRRQTIEVELPEGILDL
ncbi:MAG: 16S rRNA processing protein RimM [Prevotella sp.]|nr:16S rRNA processing protein RimM [Prevotella sp.]